MTRSTKIRNKFGKLNFEITRERQLCGLSNGAIDNYQALLVAELSFDKEKVPRVI